MTLDSVQARVLGALIEKEIVTPENYPLSLNALVNACNQKSSRDPVMALTEEQVQQALHRLEDLGLANTSRDSRVAKFEHRARTVFNLRRDETAVLCLLLLRGPQTPGELRTRSDRMYSFDGTDAVESTLARLGAAPGSSVAPTDRSTSSSELSTAAPTAQSTQPMRPLVAILPRQPGARESRYAHLLGGPVDVTARDLGAERSNPQSASAVDQASELVGRVSELEGEVAELRAAVARIEDRLQSA